MPCYSPLTAWRTAAGGIAFKSETGKPTGDLKLPCGKCTGCYLERSRQWAVRQMHEALMHDQNCSLTLTYNRDHFDWSLQPKHFTDFAKRMRAKMGRFSYFMCGEYGDENKRPHYHINVFGQNFNHDRFPYRKSHSGAQLWTSDTLDELWGMGLATISDLTFEMAAYVARYMMAKPTTEAERKRRYQRIDGDTGEEITVLPEYARMSRRPALGQRFLDKFQTDVYPNDFVVSRGRRAKPPRFYDKRLEELDQEKYWAIKFKRKTELEKNKDDNSPRRLKAKKEVAEAALRLKARNL